MRPGRCSTGRAIFFFTESLQMTRRARSAGAAWTGDARDPSLNGMFSSIQREAQHKLGGEVSIGTEAEANLVGLPLPALCLRYLFQSTVFPLSRITQITGEEGSAKSAFAYEIMRWHMIYGGGAVLAENENKDSPELRQSLLQWRQDWFSRMITKPTYSLEEWQDVFTTFVDLAAKAQDAEGGAGRTVPICFVVDSLMATAPQSEIDAIKKDGHASRGFALAANLIARYMRTMPERIKFYPFTVVGTNHLKPGTDARGLPTSTTPGGKSVKFMETFEVEMKKALGHDIDRLEYGGLRVKFVAKKNSLGPSRKSITAELLWWYENDEAGNWRQRTSWDWDTASVDLILAFESAQGKKTIYNYLRDITGITVSSKSQRKAYSSVLGYSKNDPQDYRVIGGALENRPDLLSEVYKVLGIATRRGFQPGMDYRDMQQEALAEVRSRTESLYTDASALPVVGEVDGDVDSAVEDHSGVSSEEQFDIDEEEGAR